MQLVMKHVPGCSAADVDEMIEAIDRNGDGRISFSEFRVMMGGYPLVTSPPKQIPNIKQK